MILGLIARTRRLGSLLNVGVGFLDVRYVVLLLYTTSGLVGSSREDVQGILFVARGCGIGRGRTEVAVRMMK